MSDTLPPDDVAARSEAIKRWNDVKTDGRAIETLLALTEPDEFGRVKSDVTLADVAAWMGLPEAEVRRLWHISDDADWVTVVGDWFGGD